MQGSAITLLRVGLALFSSREAERRRNRDQLRRSFPLFSSSKEYKPEARWIALLPRAPLRQTFRIFCKRRSPIYGRAKPTARWLLIAYPHLTHGHPFACYLAGLIYVNTGNDTAALPFYARA